MRLVPFDHHHQSRTQTSLYHRAHQALLPSTHIIPKSTPPHQSFSFTSPKLLTITSKQSMTSFLTYLRTPQPTSSPTPITRQPSTPTPNYYSPTASTASFIYPITSTAMSSPRTSTSSSYSQASTYAASTTSTKSLLNRYKSTANASSSSSSPTKTTSVGTGKGYRSYPVYAERPQTEKKREAKDAGRYDSQGRTKEGGGQGGRAGKVYWGRGKEMSGYWGGGVGGNV